jgi:hypothetical protein
MIEVREVLTDDVSSFMIIYWSMVVGKGRKSDCCSPSFLIVHEALVGAGNLVFKV